MERFLIVRLFVWILIFLQILSPYWTQAAPPSSPPHNPIAVIQNEYKGVPHTITLQKVPLSQGLALLESAEFPDKATEGVNLVSSVEGQLDDRTLARVASSMNRSEHSRHSYFMQIPRRIKNLDHRIRHVIEGRIGVVPPTRLDAYVATILIGSFAINWFLISDVDTFTSLGIFTFNSLLVYLFSYQKAGLALMEHTSRLSYRTAGWLGLISLRETRLFDVMARQTVGYLNSFLITLTASGIVNWRDFPELARTGTYWSEITLIAGITVLTAGLWGAVLSRWRYQDNAPLSPRATNTLHQSLKVVRASIYPLLFQGAPILPLAWNGKSAALIAMGTIATSGAIMAFKGDQIIHFLRRQGVLEKMSEMGDKTVAALHHLRRHTNEIRKIRSHRCAMTVAGF